jgi:hypothetical protein
MNSELLCAHFHAGIFIFNHPTKKESFNGCWSGMHVSFCGVFGKMRINEIWQIENCSRWLSPEIYGSDADALLWFESWILHP